MPRLKNAKHERFAQELAKGATPGPAYIKAGYGEVSHATAASNGHRLLKNAEIQARLTECLALRQQIDAEATSKAIEKLSITKERILGELAKIGFANMFDYIATQADGSAIVDLSKLDRDRAAAISEVTVDTYVDAGDGGDGEPRTVKKIKFKLMDKRAALVDMGKHLGMFIDRREVGAPGDFDEKTDEQLAHEIAAEAKDLGLIVQGSKTLN